MKKFMGSEKDIPKIIIYGTNLQAAALYRMITIEGQGEVVAFIVDRAYRKCDLYQGLPVYDAEELIDRFSPNEYQICLSFGYKNMVQNRKEKFYSCKALGYKIFSFISKNAVVYTEEIGEGCNIYPGTMLAPFVKVGKGSFIESGCIISHHSSIGEFNFLAPGVHFCGAVTTGSNCFFGGAAEIVNGCEIGSEVFVGASAKVNSDVKERLSVLPPRSTVIDKDSYTMMSYMFNERNEK